MKTVLLNDKTNSEAVRVKREYKEYIGRDGAYTSRNSYIVLNEEGRAIKLNLFLKGYAYSYIDLDLA